ncbi:MAG: transcription elongation factor 1 family protein [Candidatus Odinarchaeota archaeon]
MGRRKTKKIVVRPKPKIPAVFVCPACGKKAVKVDISKTEKIAEVKCGACKMELVIPSHALMEPVDAYGEFVDAFKRAEIKSQMSGGE